MLININFRVKNIDHNVSGEASFVSYTCVRMCVCHLVRTHGDKFVPFIWHNSYKTGTFYLAEYVSRATYSIGITEIKC